MSRKDRSEQARRDQEKIDALIRRAKHSLQQNRPPKWTPRPEQPLGHVIQRIFERAGKPVPRLPDQQSEKLWLLHWEDALWRWERGLDEDPVDQARREHIVNTRWATPGWQLMSTWGDDYGIEFADKA